MSGRGRLILISSGGVAIVAALLAIALAPVDFESVPAAGREGAGESAKEDKGKPGVQKPPSRVEEKTPAVKVVPKKAVRQFHVIEDWYENLPSSADRELGRRLQEAQDANDLTAVRKVVEDARTSKNAEIRKAAVEALGWFGKDALSELTGFLNDRDPAVAKAAFDAWELSVDAIDDENTRAKVSGMAMMALSDEEKLKNIAAKLEAVEDKKVSVKAIVDVVEHGSPQAAEAAKEAYAFIMGEKWISPDAARIKSLIDTGLE